MSKANPEIKQLFERMRKFTRNSKVAVITAKAPTMTQAELDRCNTASFNWDYIGLLR